MTFDSLSFAIFLPIVFASFWSVRHHLRLQNSLLLMASYLFYGWWDWRFLSLLLITTTTSYMAAIRIERAIMEDRKAAARCWNIVNATITLLILGIFKYYDFFASSFSELMQAFGFETDWPMLHLVLPMGISFYTFQALSYTIDVWREQIRAERNWLTFAAYLAFFPQLVAGPIERASRLLPQFAKPRHFIRAEAVQGCRQMLWGFAKKIVIADNCAPIVERIFSEPEAVGGSAILYGAVLFAIQIYADFSGYSDIAIGTARLFGFRLTANFDNPYFATSIPDFWRRWHISLTSWFRDYVYIPLGGSRKGRYRTYLNTVIVFSLSGLWHGANWTFVAWGLYHGLLFLPWNMGWLQRAKGPDTRSMLQRLPSIAITFLLVCIGWIFFRADSIGCAFLCIGRMLTQFDLLFMQYSKSIIVLVALMLWAEWYRLPLPQTKYLRWAVYYVLIGLMLVMATTSTQFIYFQF